MKNTSRKPYIYKVTNLETGQYYIGSQCSGKIVGMNYFTSSTNKEFKDGFKTHGEKYEIAIIKSFTDPKKCVRVENYIIRNYMLLKDGLCLNRFYCCGNEKIFSTVGHTAWNNGLHHSGETRKRISESLKGHSSPKKGIPCSEETRKKISTTKKGQSAWNKGLKGVPLPEEIKNKISTSLKGRPSPNRIKISIEGEVFDSIRAASKYYNVSVNVIRNWIKTNKHNTTYIEKCPKI